jgi:diguanylate cyclase (GGDEF)-like protein/PAS domain S-box-containing protein
MMTTGKRRQTQTAQSIAESSGNGTRRAATEGSPDGEPRGSVALVERSVGAKEDEALPLSGDDRFKRLFEHSNDMVFFLEPEGITTMVNPATERIMGFGPGETIGTNFMEHIAPADRARAGALLARLLAGTDVVSEELELVAKDGHQVFADVSARPVEVDGRLVGVEGIARDVTERHALQEALVRQALHDSLTGLPNRTLFFDRLGQALARAERDSSRVAVLLLDLDRFKLINDSFGHGLGDEVLVGVARALERESRGGEGVARLGGDEFVFVIENVVSESELARVAARILSALGRLLVVDDRVAHVTGSLGIALADPGDDSASLLRNADIAMYQAKARQRGGFVFFDPKTRVSVLREFEFGRVTASGDERGVGQEVWTGSERAHRLGASVSDLIVRIGLSPEPAFEYVSDAVESITGYTPEECYAEPGLVFSLVHPDDRPLVEKALAKPDRELFRMRVVRKDGRVVWLEQSAAGVYDKSGALVAVEAISRDVTERVVSEQEVAEVRDHLEATLQAIPDLLFEVDSSGRFLDYRAPQMGLLAAPPERFLGRTISEVLPAPVAQTINEALLEAAEAGYAHGHVYSLAVADGIRWFELSAARMTGDSESLRFVVLARDITTRKSAELELAATSATLKAIVEASPVAISAVDHSRRITIWNPAAERMFGFGTNEAVGHALPHIPPELWEEAQALTEQALAGESIRPFETERLRKDGTRVPVVLALAPLRDQNGEVTSALAMLSDITEQMLARRQLAESFADLTRLDGERRRLLDRLVRAQEEERARIGADIHDDSVQVLTALAMRLELFRGQLDDPEALASVEELERIARASIARLRHLIFELHPPALDRDGLITALRLYLEQLRVERGIESTIEANLTSEPDDVARMIVYRIAQEALLNVAKHAQATRVDVSIEQSVPGTHVRISDNGVGLPFELSSLNPDAPGLSGSSQPGHIGLIAMRERAEMAGGWCNISSEQGRGTTVEFFVPDTAVEPAPPAS